MRSRRPKRGKGTTPDVEELREPNTSPVSRRLDTWTTRSEHYAANRDVSPGSRHYRDEPSCLKTLLVILMLVVTVVTVKAKVILIVAVAVAVALALALWFSLR